MILYYYYYPYQQQQMERLGNVQIPEPVTSFIIITRRTMESFTMMVSFVREMGSNHNTSFHWNVISDPYHVISFSPLPDSIVLCLVQV